eukprot:1838579-Amphidinium_carterae.1
MDIVTLAETNGLSSLSADVRESMGPHMDILRESDITRWHEVLACRGGQGQKSTWEIDIYFFLGRTRVNSCHSIPRAGSKPLSVLES